MLVLESQSRLSDMMNNFSALNREALRYNGSLDCLGFDFGQRSENTQCRNRDYRTNNRNVGMSLVGGKRHKKVVLLKIIKEKG